MGFSDAMLAAFLQANLPPSSGQSRPELETVARMLGGNSSARPEWNTSADSTLTGRLRVVSPVAMRFAIAYMGKYHHDSSLEL